jgi:hypothetical protein
MWQRHHVAGDLQPRWYVPNAADRRKKIKRQTIEQRRKQHCKAAA